MTEKFVEIRSLKSETLIELIAKLAERERVVTAELVLHLAELERRKAYRDLGFGSLWSYLRESLGMSEGFMERMIEEAKREPRYSVAEEDQSVSGPSSP